MLSATTALPAPAAPTDGNNIQFRLNRSFIDGGPDLARLPLADPDKPVTITDCNNCSESRPLTRVGLFLDKSNSQNLLLNIRQERVDDLRLFDPQSLSEDLFHRNNLSLLDLSAELCLRDPSDLLTRPLTHRRGSTGAVETVFLTSSKCPDKSSGFSPRLRYALKRFL
jgi:hypothetical protein